MKVVKVSIELTEAQALGLAQLAKRATWSGLRALAVEDDETYVMRDALAELAKALAEAGFAPR